MDTIIADITRAYTGSEDGLLKSLFQVFPNEQERKVLICCNEYQRNNIQTSPSLVEFKVFPEESRLASIIEGIREIIGNINGEFSAENKILVLSFHGAVLKLREEDSYKNFVEFKTWKEIREIGERAGLGISFGPFVWPSTLMSEDEAIRLLLRTLRKNRATQSRNAIRQADLRYYLGVEDGRFRKTYYNPAAKTPGLLKYLVKSAEERELISVDRTDDVNPRLWLGREGRLASAPQESSKEKDSVKSRSQEFIDSLRQKHLGPFSRFRQLIYDSLEAVVHAEYTQAPTVNSVLARTVDKTREKCEQSGLEVKDIPWKEVRYFLINLMSRCPVLLSENNQPLAPTFLTLTSKVSGLKEEWRRDLESELIVALVEQFSDITVLDTPLLAGALYFSRTEEKEEEIAGLISYLIQKKRLEVSTEYPYSLNIFTESENS